MDALCTTLACVDMNCENSETPKNDPEIHGTSPAADFLTATEDYILYTSTPPSLAPPPLVATLHIVCRQHAGLPGSLHRAVHPAFVDGLSVDDDVAVPERDLVVVLGCVVVQRPVNTHGG